MKFTTAKEIYTNIDEYADSTVTLGGWVRTVRTSKTFGFIELNDGTFFKSIQIVFEDNLDNYMDISKLNVGSSIIVEGVLVKTPEAKQPFEVKATSITIEGKSTPEYPLQKRDILLNILEVLPIFVQEQILFLQFLG